MNQPEDAFKAERATPVDARWVARAVAIGLATANLAFLAWVAWIAQPPVPATSRQTLPQLVLASEMPPTEQAPADCLSVGPFPDEYAADRAETVLRERGIASRRRTDSSTAEPSYWVYVGGLDNVTEEMAALRRLESAGITDASLMPATEQGGHRISLGIFSERDRADRRLATAARLGLTVRLIERRQSETVYRLEVATSSLATALPLDELAAAQRPPTESGDNAPAQAAAIPLSTSSCQPMTGQAR